MNFLYSFNSSFVIIIPFLVSVDLSFVYAYIVLRIPYFVNGIRSFSKK